MKRLMRPLIVLIAITALATVLPAAGAKAPRHATDITQTNAYQQALKVAIKAYVYGYPLLDTNRVYRTATSVNVSDGIGGGPVNQFSHFRRLAAPTDKTVVAPNRDTLYSMAWLNLARQPIVLHMPVVAHRFTVMELLDPYTNNFAAVGDVGLPPGNYAITAPRWRGRLPKHMKQLRSPYTRVWVIGRTYIKDAADTPNVVRIQDEYSLTPLDKWGTRYKPARPKHVISKPTSFTVPGTKPGQNPIAFFDALGDALKQFPPPPADRPLLSQLRRIGIGPGLHPGADTRLDAATRRALHDAVAVGAAQITADVRAAFLSGAPKDNGWLVSRTGTYGTDYAARAVVDQIGLGAPVPEIAIYPFTITDKNLSPLTGPNRYVAHFSARNLPFPVKAFWSMTLYDSHGFFVQNGAHVYLINNRSDVVYNGDGSLDIYIQPSPPSDPHQRRNWLPSPLSGAFRLIMRLYEPINVAGILSGSSWQPPTVLPCLQDGKTAGGTSCAS